MIGNAGAIFVLIKIAWQFATQQKVLTCKFAKVGFILILLADFAVYCGNIYDSSLISETKEKGDVILQMAQNFQISKGHFPETIESLSSAGFKIPEPSLKGTHYRYKLSSVGSHN